MMKKHHVFDEVCRLSPGVRQVVNHAKRYNRVNRRFVPVRYTSGQSTEFIFIHALFVLVCLLAGLKNSAVES
jgi:hypothetical protein